VVDITRMIILNEIEKSKDKAVNMLVEYVWSSMFGMFGRLMSFG